MLVFFMNTLEIIAQELEEGYQVHSVWLVPPSSHISVASLSWELRIKKADWFPLGEGDSPIKMDVDYRKIPKGVDVIAKEKVGDTVVELPPMSDEQAEAIGLEIKKVSDATSIQKTSSGCWAIGPCANWVRDPLRMAIINSRKNANRRKTK